MAHTGRGVQQITPAEYAGRLPSGEPEDWYGLAFGTPNVLIHQVAAEVEPGEGARAVALAARPGDPTGRIEASRVGHHYIDLARGQMMHGGRTAALTPCTQPAGPHRRRPGTTRWSARRWTS